MAEKHVAIDGDELEIITGWFFLLAPAHAWQKLGGKGKKNDNNNDRKLLPKTVMGTENCSPDWDFFFQSPCIITAVRDTFLRAAAKLEKKEEKGIKKNKNGKLMVSLHTTQKKNGLIPLTT